MNPGWRSPGRWLFVAAFALLAAGLGPGLYFRDAGQLDAAAFTLGIAHPPGFALYLLLAHAATLLPLGEVATRVNLLSALGGAAAVLFVYRLGRRLVAATGDGAGAAGETIVVEAAAITGAVLLLADLGLWRQAVVAGVVAPSAAVLALLLEGIVFVALAPESSPTRARVGGLLALGCGLALGLHLAVLGLAGPPLAGLALLRLRRGDRWPLVAPLLFCVGAGVVLYLPVAAARGAADGLGDPRTLAGLLDYWSATGGGAGWADQPLAGGLAGPAQRLGTVAAIIESQLGLPALAAAGLGLLHLAHRRRGLALLLVWGIAAEALHALWISPLGLADPQAGAPSAVALVAAAGVGVAAAVRRLAVASAGTARAAATAFTLAFLAIAPALFNQPASRFAAGSEADAWTRAALRDVPSRALVLLHSDDLVAGVEYQELVTGLRPDVTILRRQALWDARHLGRAAAAAGYVALSSDEVAAWRSRPERSRIRDQREIVDRLLAKNLGLRAVLWEPGEEPPPRGALSEESPLFLLDAHPAPAPAARPIAARVEQLLGRSRDPLARRLAATTVARLSASYIGRGDDLNGEPLAQLARSFRAEDPTAATLLAGVRARRGDTAGALAELERVLARAPDHRAARLEAARLRLQVSDLDGAAADFELLRRREPAAAAPLVGLARVAHARGDDATARRLIDRALQLAPHDAAARLANAEFAP